MSLVIKLNGSNYVSDRRKEDFEQGLQEAAPNAAGGNAPNAAGGSAPSQPGAAERTATPATAHAPSGGNGYHSEPVPQHPGVRLAQTAGMPTPTTGADTGNGHGHGNGHLHLLESLERGLAQSYGHQSETLHVHQQYLRNQAEYARLFSQLLQQQAQLFAHGKTPSAGPEQAELALTVLQSLSRSLEQLHSHQVEGSDVHQAFLNQQAEYALAFVELLGHKYGALKAGGNGYHGNGNGNGNGNGQKRPVPALPPAVQPVTPHSNFPAARTAPAGDGAPAVEPPPSVALTPVTARPPVTAEPLAQPPRAPAPPAIDAGMLQTALLAIVSDKTGYPAEMLELDMDMEADLGIDSIKRVEILGALQDQHPDLPEVDTATLAELRTLAQVCDYMSAATSAPSEARPTGEPAAPSEGAIATERSAPSGEGIVAGALKQDLLTIVSDKTGYPAEMLELDMDMEADLGIDSIKRVEILGALQDQHPDLPEVDTATLAELRTLSQIVAYMEQQTTPESQVAVPEPVKKV